MSGSEEAAGTTIPRTGRGQTVRRMRDIARLAGVSESTVSRALADSPLVNEETKARVRRIAQEHSYVVNEQARNFRLKRTGTIAVVIPIDDFEVQTLSDPFFMELLGSIADALNARGFDLLLSRVDAASSGWRKAMHDTRRADGTILIGQSTQHRAINRLADADLPLVVWGGRLPDQRYPTVGCDNERGGLLATEHLIACGRRRIAFLGHLPLPEVELRYRGHVQALRAAGMQVDPELVYDSRFSSDDARRAVTRMLAASGRPPIDALFASSDVLAMAAITALKERGLSVPEDVAVVGFDDIALAAWYNPPLTTVRQHIAEGGRLLVERMMERLEGRKVAPVMLAPELVIRGSSA